jgi:hypothetical protein
MFGLFRPSCPCDPAAKDWVERRLQWLVEEFHNTAFTGRQVVRPTPDFFPDPYDGSKKAVRTLLDRVCDYMDVVPDLVALKFIQNAGQLWLVNEAGQALPDAAGTYEEGKRKFIIRIARTELGDPMGLVGTMAHELAHARLLGEGRIMREEFDNELLTDLTTVAFGLGVFLANTPRNWDSHLKKWPDSDLNRPEYMSPPMFGHALAHVAWHAGEEWPDWAGYLNWSVRGEFKQALRFLQKTGDSWFRPKRWRRATGG